MTNYMVSVNIWCMIDRLIIFILVISGKYNKTHWHGMYKSNRGNLVRNEKVWYNIQHTHARTHARTHNKPRQNTEIPMFHDDHTGSCQRRDIQGICRQQDHQRDGPCASTTLQFSHIRRWDGTLGLEYLPRSISVAWGTSAQLCYNCPISLIFHSKWILLRYKIELE